ncbi:NAD-dependent epimerase/dehydratase family protein [Myxococcaceae bacterium JPH2]|nr:NAD-dependent epimerase/dehydratase family protein [Myxococcaceae bacterium JPH2]
MGKNILVIGGTRFFGRLLVRGLVDVGHQVTLATRGRATDAFGSQVRRIRVDRRDEAAMSAAFAAAGHFDVVYDQMCYSPLDAAISTRVFAGRVSRYVMASTIEVYRALYGSQGTPFREEALDLSREPIERAFPWHESELPEARYGQGKRQAEAYFQQDGSLPVVSVRIGHVLAGPEDFTGRLAHYVRLVKARAPLRCSQGGAGSSFIDAEGISAFLRWVGDGTFLGPINASSEGALSALDIHRRVAEVLDVPPLVETVDTPVNPTELSPFDYPEPYVMDTQRARSLGYRLGHTREWLDGLIRQHDAALQDQGR